MNNYLRLGHFSDLHFHCLSFNPLLYFNKRIKGTLRQIFCLPKFKPEQLLGRLPNVVKQLNIENICITGDFTLTSLDKEFLLAKKFVEQLQNQNINVDVFPGNHDCYTKSDFLNQTFYKYFPNSILQEKKIYVKKLSNHWLLINLDCSYRNSFFTAHGKVYAEQLIFLKKILDNSQTHNIIIANHYPLLPSHDKTHDLLNGKKLLSMLPQYKNVRAYIHGHTHYAEIKTIKKASLLLINSGSTSLIDNSCFHILDLYEKKIEVHLIRLENIQEKNSPLQYKSKKKIEVIF